MGRLASAIAFFGIAIGITVGLHYYFWARLVRDTALPPPWRALATGAIVTLGAAMVLVMPLRRFLSPAAATALAWPAFVWMGAMFLLFALLLATDLVRAVAALGRLGLAEGSNVADPGRRAALARAVGGAVAASAGGLGAIALRSGLALPRIRDVRVELPRLPRSWNGLTIAQITDLHIGATIGRDLVEDVVRRTNALAADIIAITGDLVDDSVARLRHAVAPLADLRARHGVYFVTGNHEYYSGVDEWIPELGRLGMRVLRNERVSIGEGPHAFDLAGVNDWSARRNPSHAPDLARALAGRDSRRELILLAHQPKAIHEAARLGVGLQLSGHTHGGQIWPFGYLVRLQQPFVLGLFRVQNTWLYVSPGTGYWGPPMRLATTPEITRLTLTSSGAGALAGSAATGHPS